MALDADQLQQRYEEIRSYIGWTEADQCRVRNVRPVLEPRLSSIVDAFYAEIQSFPSIAHLLSGGPKQIERLKGTLTDWLRDLFESPHDAAYRARHFRAGRKHVEIGLEQFYVNGGLSRIRSWLIDALFEQASEVAELAATIDSLNRALDLDLTLIDLAYHDAAMSAQEHVAEQLRTALVAADAGSRSKSAFLANMSHEVRSPINAIIGMTDLVLGTPLTAEQRDRLTIVQDSSEALLSLINDILDYSRIEQNRLELEETEFSLVDCISASLKTLAIQAHAKGIELVANLDPDLCRTVVGDPLRFRQILLNLVGNAIKFTVHGEVVVRCDSVSREPDRQTIRLEVNDTGMGIPVEKRDYIFDAFEQSDPSIARRYGGTGLGLAITSRLIEMMGGTLTFESELNRGTTFTVSVPFRVSADSGPCHLDVEGFGGLRVLVVEEHRASSDALRRMLQSWQATVHTARNVDQAQELLRQAGSVHSSYDVTLVSSGLVDACQPKTICECLDAGSVVLMLTSSETTADFQEVTGAASIVKPVSPPDLFTILTGLVAGESAAVSQENGVPQHSSRPSLRILLAEDQQYNQVLATALLERAGHEVTLANNGAEACMLVERDDFDLVLMDVRMPQVDGLEATRRIRDREAETGEHIPIVAMTAEAMQGDAERCLEYGMDAYLAKPIREPELLKAIDSLMHSSGLPGQETGCGSVDCGQEQFDWSVALGCVNGDQELLRRIVVAFLEEYASLLARLDRACEEKDSEALRLAAHGLKGALRTFGVERAEETASEVELMAVSKKWNGVDESVAFLKDEVENLASHFAALVRNDR